MDFLGFLKSLRPPEMDSSLALAPPRAPSAAAQPGATKGDVEQYGASKTPFDLGAILRSIRPPSFQSDSDLPPPAGDVQRPPVLNAGAMRPPVFNPSSPNVVEEPPIVRALRSIFGGREQSPEQLAGPTGDEEAGALPGEDVGPYRGGDRFKAEAQRAMARGRTSAGPAVAADPTRDIHAFDPSGLPAQAPQPSPRRRAPVGPAPDEGGMVRTSAAGPSGMKEIPGPAQPSAAGAFPDEQPMPSRKSLGDRYAQLVAGMPKGKDGALSDEQKGYLMMELGLNMMAKSSRPGATALGAFGEAGADTVGKARGQIETNRTRERESRREGIDEAYRQIGFEDKDADNVRGDRKQVADERNAKARIDLLRQQVETGKYTVQKTNQGLVVVDQKTGKATVIKDEQGRPIRPDPKENANIQFYSWLMEDPKRTELFLGSKGKTLTDEDVVDKALKLVQGSMGQLTLDQAIDQVKRGVDVARGAPGAGLPPKPATEAEAKKQAGDAKKRGVPIEQINQRLKAWGYSEIK